MAQVKCACKCACVHVCVQMCVQMCANVCTTCYEMPQNTIAKSAKYALKCVSHACVQMCYKCKCVSLCLCASSPPPPAPPWGSSLQQSCPIWCFCDFRQISHLSCHTYGRVSTFGANTCTRNLLAAKCSFCQIRFTSTHR